ncbi:LuxR C-terminal-related transcriptional regulator [Kitasatospora sp. NPDC094028]
MERDSGVLEPAPAAAELRGLVGADEEEFDAALSNVRMLIDTAAHRYRKWTQRSRPVELVEPGIGPVREAIVNVISGARASVDIVLSASPRRTKELCADLRKLLAVLDRAVSVRMLCTHVGMQHDFVVAELAGDWPIEVRPARIPSLEAVIVDRHVSVVRTAVGADASVVRSAVVIDALGALFDNVWQSAGAPRVRTPAPEHEHTEIARQVLARLLAGATDEKAARELRISVRTYRRHVAEILESLGTKSRFRAGMLAAEMGMLAPRPGPHRNPAGLRAPVSAPVGAGS